VTKGMPQARGLARREAMLRAATELFLEKGYDDTSLAEIVERSKGSRSTLYEQFGGKEGLLRAMIENSCARVWEVIGLAADAPSLAEEALVELGVRFVGAALAPDAVAVCRIVTAEGHRIPGIAEHFFDSGPRILQQRLGDRFRAALAVGDDGESPEHLAKIFLGAVLGDFHFRETIGLAPRPGPAEIATHVRVAVRIFLQGLGRRLTRTAVDGGTPPP